MDTGEIHYKVNWRAKSSYPGHHSSRQKGGGLEFSNHVSLLDAPDPRRFDIHASLRDPFQQLRVRVYQQTSSIPVYVIADLSASMNFKGLCSKKNIMADFVSCISYSAYRTGDSFGFIGCSDELSEPLKLSATFNRAAGIELAGRLRNKQFNGINANGLLSSSEHLGTRHALVFLVSDFHFPLDFLNQLLTSLTNHDVIPVMLWDKQEFEELPDFGLLRLIDPETRKNRLLIMRPALKKQIQEEAKFRHQKLVNLFSSYGRMPLLLQEEFKADEVTHYFFS